MDLADNKIQRPGIEQMVESMKASTNLLTLDLRGNTGYNARAHARLVAVLRRNVRKLRGGDKDEYTQAVQKRLICNELFDSHLAEELAEREEETLAKNAEDLQLGIDESQGEDEPDIGSPVASERGSTNPRHTRRSSAVSPSIFD